MDRDIAETLVSEMQRHGNTVTPDSELFLDLLVSSEVPESSRFYEALADNQQAVNEPERYHHLSLRRILRNANAEGYQPNILTKGTEAVGSMIGIYSSDSLSRNLRENANLVNLMANSLGPYSLLGKFQTYDLDNHDGKIFVVTSPVLVIPGVDAAGLRTIHDWEQQNTTYQTEKKIFFHLFSCKRPIDPKIYFSQ